MIFWKDIYKNGRCLPTFYKIQFDLAKAEIYVAKRVSALNKIWVALNFVHVRARGILKTKQDVEENEEEDSY